MLSHMCYINTHNSECYTAPSYVKLWEFSLLLCTNAVLMFLFLYFPNFFLFFIYDHIKPSVLSVILFLILKGVSLVHNAFQNPPSNFFFQWQYLFSSKQGDFTSSTHTPESSSGPHKIMVLSIEAESSFRGCSTESPAGGDK